MPKKNPNPFRRPWRVLFLILAGPLSAVLFIAGVWAVTGYKANTFWGGEWADNGTRVVYVGCPKCGSQEGTGDVQEGQR